MKNLRKIVRKKDLIVSLVASLVLFCGGILGIVTFIVWLIQRPDPLALVGFILSFAWTLIFILISIYNLVRLMEFTEENNLGIDEIITNTTETVSEFSFNFVDAIQKKLEELTEEAKLTEETPVFTQESQNKEQEIVYPSWKVLFNKSVLSGYKNFTVTQAYNNYINSNNLSNVKKLNFNLDAVRSKYFIITEKKNPS